jgi:hypothetical protein
MYEEEREGWREEGEPPLSVWGRGEPEGENEKRASAVYTL